MAVVYCGSCGAALADTARFCRSCGSSQEAFASPAPPPAAVRAAKAMPAPATPGHAAPPPPGPPPPVQAPARTGDAVPVAATLALVGGIGICLLALYSLAFLPLKHGLSYTYDEPPRLLDVLTLAAGVFAALGGAQLLRRPAANRQAVGAVLVGLGLPALALTIVTLYPETFNVDYFSYPFYVNYAYFTGVLGVHVGHHYLPVPLLVSQALIVLGGLTMLAAPRHRTPPPGWR